MYVQGKKTIASKNSISGTQKKKKKKTKWRTRTSPILKDWSPIQGLDYLKLFEQLHKNSCGDPTKLYKRTSYITSWGWINGTLCVMNWSWLEKPKLKAQNWKKEIINQSSKSSVFLSLQFFLPIDILVSIPWLHFTD